MSRNYKIIFSILTILLIFSLSFFYKSFKNKIVSIESDLNEISGIEFDKDGNLWGINDSGNPPELYRIDSLGNITKTISITNAKNIDWEDMTQNGFGHFFIGDFGNNKNHRRDLTIYKIENPVDIRSEQTTAEIIKFKFEDQFSFPETDSTKIFDLEAFVYYKNQLYLFTKNRTNPFDGFTHLYKMGQNAANYKAKYISKFNTCTSNKYLCWVTSAALNNKRDQLALLSSNKIWLFEDWEGDDFFSGKVKEIDLGIVTQKEAITFYNDSVLIYTDEKFKGIGGNIYYLNINE